MIDLRYILLHLLGFDSAYARMLSLCTISALQLIESLDLTTHLLVGDSLLLWQVAIELVEKIDVRLNGHSIKVIPSS